MYRTAQRVLPLRRNVAVGISKPLRFSSTTTPKMSYEYLVTIPDHANSLDKRLAARPKHLANLKPHIDSGKVVFGGASLSKHPSEGEAPDMTVSLAMFSTTKAYRLANTHTGQRHADQSKLGGGGP